jgi:hypothetical protein
LNFSGTSGLTWNVPVGSSRIQSIKFTVWNFTRTTWNPATPSVATYAPVNAPLTYFDGIKWMWQGASMTANCFWLQPPTPNFAGTIVVSFGSTGFTGNAVAVSQQEENEVTYSEGGGGDTGWSKQTCWWLVTYSNDTGEELYRDFLGCTYE